jgi:hypothetical protein
MILQTELATLDSEIAQLQALIESKRQRAEVLVSAENLASEALARLTQALCKIEEVAPAAIHNLKSAVLTLFAEQPLSSSSSDFEKIKTVSAGQPQKFTPGSLLIDRAGSFGVVVGGNNLGMRVDWLGLGSCPNPASGKGCWFDWEKDSCAIASLNPATHDRIKLLTTEEFLQFQGLDKNQLAEHWDNEWFDVGVGCECKWGGATINRWIVVFAQSCDWTSPIACLLEDCPESSLTGQSYELFCELLSVEVPLTNEAIAYTADAVTIGCNNQSRLKSWGEWLYRQDWGLTRQQCYQGRKSKRMIGFKYELELPALLPEQLEVLFQQDFTKQPVLPTAIPIPAPKHQPKIQRGDKVVLTLTPSETWEATTELATDNRFFAKSLLDGRRELMNFHAVTIVDRAA